jgi:Uncharacterized protein conserved in bacteria (DUF2188)
MTEVHVVPQGGDWGIEVGGNIRSTHNTRDEAIRHGRHLAEELAGELVIHDSDGRVREKDSHGNDPPSIPG